MGIIDRLRQSSNVGERLQMMLQQLATDAGTTGHPLAMTPPGMAYQAIQAAPAMWDEVVGANEAGQRAVGPVVVGEDGRLVSGGLSLALEELAAGEYGPGFDAAADAGIRGAALAGGTALAGSKAPRGALRSMGGRAVDDFAAKYPGVKISLSRNGKNWTVNQIVVPKDMRGQGIGTEIMRRIMADADAEGATLSLSPSADFGGSVPRLKRFYKDLGFIENKGRARDFEISESMYREPAPLPMDEASRMARARDMGFDVDNPLYHGTTKAFRSFDPGRSDSARKTGTPAGAFVFTDSAENAKTYAGRNNRLEWSEVYDEGGNVLPAYARLRNPMEIDAGGNNWRDVVLDGEFMDINEAAHIAKNDGYDGLIVRNVVDSADSVGQRPATTTFVFDPKNIRSRFAAFNPARADSDDLLASRGILPVPMPTEEDRQGILRYLEGK